MILLGLFLAPLMVGYVLSHLLTRRHRPDERRWPAEYGLDYEEVTFPARDGLTLRGWWIPASGAERAVIFLHGYGGSMDPDVQYVPALHQAGFYVLMFDFRAHGRSDGQMTTVGYLERQDALGALDFVRAKGIERIGLLGFSMGGVVAMLTAPLCPAVRAVVVDGAPVRLSSALAGRGIEYGLPRWLSLASGWLTVAVTSLWVRANLFHYEPIRWVGQIAPRPLMFIYGARDQFVPAAELDALIAAAHSPKEVWRDPQAGHRTLDQLYPDEYRRRIVAFFDQYL